MKPSRSADENKSEIAYEQALNSRLCMRRCSSALMPVLLTPFTWHTEESWRFNKRLTCRARELASDRRFACALVECEGAAVADPKPAEAMSNGRPVGRSVVPSVYRSLMFAVLGRGKVSLSLSREIVCGGRCCQCWARTVVVEGAQRHPRQMRRLIGCSLWEWNWLYQTEWYREKEYLGR